jgi:hypothetical protein
VVSQTRRTFSSLCFLIAAFAVIININIAGTAQAQGIVGRATDNGARPRLSAGEIQKFLPQHRGPFTFPAPYNTQGVRLTEAADCGGSDCVYPVGYSYWSNINNHVGSDEMLVLIGLKGPGPSLFSYNKKTGVTQNRGSIFAGDGTYGWATLSTGEGWYFSATRPHALYINEPVGSREFRYDVLSHSWETVFDASSQFGGNKYIWQVHSSNDDRVHSATIRDKSSYAMEGCMVYREDQHKFLYYPKKGNDFDECQIDKSGKWLLIKEDLDGKPNEDNRIINIETGQERDLMDPDGAAGHSDLGYGYLVAEDNFNPQPGAVRVWDFNMELKGGEPVSSVRGQGILAYQASKWFGSDGVAPGLGHIAHGNSRPGVSIDQQMACASNATATDVPRANEIVCFRLNDSLTTLMVAPNMTDVNASGGAVLGSDVYWKLPKGNLDLTGEYFIWTSNAGTGRLDAFIVKVPQDQLGVVSGSSSSNSVPDPTPSTDSGSSASTSPSTSTPSSDCQTIVLTPRIGGKNSIPVSGVRTAASCSPIPSSGTSSTSTPPPAPAPAPSSSTAGAAGAVSWTSVVNATANGGNLMKSGGCGGCPDAGAVSSQKIASGDGYVEFSVTESKTLRFIGLSSGNNGTAAEEIKFALRLQNGVAEVRESGAYRSETGFAAGDTFRIAIVGGKVQYSKNGGVFFTSSAAPSYPALVDTSLFDDNAEVWNVQIAGAQ